MEEAIITFASLGLEEDKLLEDIKEALAQNGFPRDMKFLRFLRRANDRDFRNLAPRVKTLRHRMKIFMDKRLYVNHTQGIKIKIKDQMWESYDNELHNG